MPGRVRAAAPGPMDEGKGSGAACMPIFRPAIVSCASVRLRGRIQISLTPTPSPRPRPQTSAGLSLEPRQWRVRLWVVLDGMDELS